jgi:hypothetical protein
MATKMLSSKFTPPFPRKLHLEHTFSFATWANIEDPDFIDWHTPCTTFVRANSLMAIEVPSVAAVGQLDDPALNEKSDAYAEHTSSSVNPVIESAEFALLVSDLFSLALSLSPCY